MNKENTEKVKGSYNLFLDDYRVPSDAYIYTRWAPFLSKEWIIVRNYNEFVQVIDKQGLPEWVSFDHDLAENHYVPKEYWGDYEASKAYQDAQEYKEKTGYECALWLIEYCKEKGFKLPYYYCHSMNPVGKDRILSALDNFKLHEKE